MAMRGKCERGRGSVNVAAARANVIRREAADGFVGEGERRGGNINADGAGAEVFAGDGCSQGTSFVPMAAISRRWRGGRIYNNTRTRERLRRMCVKPAALTTHSPPKTFARPRTATRPSRTLPLPHAAPTHARRLRDARPPTAQLTPRRRPSLAPAQRHALPEHFRSPTQRRRTPAGCAMHSPPTSPPLPAEDLRPPPHSNTPFPSTFSLPPLPDAHPQAARCIPRRPHNPFPVEDLLPPPHNDAPFPCPPATSPQPRRTPADLTTHSPPKTFARPRSASLPPLPFRFGHKKTAPHSGCAMPNVSVDRRCGRSFGLVSRALFAAVAGRWRVGVGLRPQPWALRSRRCGRVLRA